MAKKEIQPRNIMDMVLAESDKRAKGDIYTAVQQTDRMVGIEHYSLALQWLIHSNIIPLQSILTLAAPPKCFKTSALLEMIRVFIQAGGSGLLVNTEGKLSPTKISSIIRSDLDKLHLTAPGTTNEWVETVSNRLTIIHDVMENLYKANNTNSKAEGLDAYRGHFLSPVIIGIDSLSGNQSESMGGRVQAGEVGKTFNDRAMIITQFLNVWSSLLVGLPVTMLLINHEKQDMEGQRTTPGGVAPAFHTSLDIRVSRVGEDKLAKDGVPYTVTRLRWWVNFSSIGKDHRSLDLTYIDTYDENENQVCWFDWDSALVDLLKRLQTDENLQREHKNLKDIVTIEEYNCGNKGYHYSCPQIGIKNKEDALANGVNKARLGSMLQSDANMRKALQQALRIQVFNRWSPQFMFPCPKDLPAEYKPKPQGRR